MPPHTGHQYLIRFAQEYAGKLDLFVCTLASEPIPGAIRYEWMRELFPAAKVTHITDEIPEAARDQEGAEEIWARSLRRRMDHDPAYVFASESYGLALASALGAEFVPVDPQRSVFPVSAGMIRDDPFEYWQYIPDAVRPYFARRVVVLGDHEEASQMCSRLAREFSTISATDYTEFVRRTSFKSPATGGRIAAAKAQIASENALLGSANRILFTPTDPDLVPLADQATNATRTPPLLVVALQSVPDWYQRQVQEAGGTILSGSAANVDAAQTFLVETLTKK